MKYKPISEDLITTYNINSCEFNAEYENSVSENKITEKMGYFILQLANNIVVKYHKKYRFELILEMHQYIVMDVTNRLLTFGVRHDAFATISVTMQNRCKNFLRNVGRGNVDIYGSRIGNKTNKLKFISLTDYEDNKQNIV